jgi:hypothetical protein
MEFRCVLSCGKNPSPEHNIDLAVHTSVTNSCTFQERISRNAMLGAAFHLTLFRMPVASSKAERIVDHGLNRLRKKSISQPLRPLGLKPALIEVTYAALEGPLFHATPGVVDFFRSLLKPWFATRGVVPNRIPGEF